jgi:hypothetical protein
MPPLPHQPTPLLATPKPPWVAPRGERVLSVPRVCGAPFVEEAAKDLPFFLRRARQAVGKFREPSWQEIEKSCLTALASSERSAGFESPPRGQLLSVQCGGLKRCITLS